MSHAYNCENQIILQFLSWKYGLSLLATVLKLLPHSLEEATARPFIFSYSSFCITYLCTFFCCCFQILLIDFSNTENEKLTLRDFLLTSKYNHLIILVQIHYQIYY